MSFRPGGHDKLLPGKHDEAVQEEVRTLNIMENRDLTLVIPTYNRSDLFARLLQHLANSHWASPIVIADSSDPESLLKNKEAVSRHRGVLVIDHVCLPPSTPPILKWANVVSRVKSEYVVMCADDDLLVPDAVIASALFLSQNLGYSLCHGAYLGYNYRIFGDVSSGVTMGSDSYSDSIEQESASERLLALYKTYAATMYGVHRTASMQAIFTSICEYLPSRLVYGAFQELIQSSLVVIQGKIKRLPILYSVRKGWPSTEGWEVQLARKDYSTHLESTRSCIVNELTRRDSVSATEASQLFDAAFVSYLRSGIGSLPFPERFKAHQPRSSGVLHLDPNSIKMLLEKAGAAYGSIKSLLEDIESSG